MGVEEQTKVEDGEKQKQEKEDIKWRLDQLVKKKDKKVSPEDFGYLAVPDIDLQWPRQETQPERIWRKCYQNPFVPIGLGVTVVALTYGVFNMRGGNQIVSQRMMRLRVGAQGFTVIALLAGVAYDAHTRKLAREAKKAEREAAMAVIAAATK